MTAGSPRIIWSGVLCKQPGRYIGWPTIARLNDQELFVAFSGDRLGHVCPYGKTQMVRSADGGKTWSAPATINDTPLDDRDAGLLVTQRGTVLLSWFTSLVFADDLPRYELSWRRQFGDEAMDAWKRQAAGITAEQRSQWLGYWVRRSEDGGRTWGLPIRTHVNTPHGPIQLRDGRLLFVGGSQAGQAMLNVDMSPDDGQSWQLYAQIPLADGDKLHYCHEPHVVETADGRLVTLIRYHRPYSEGFRETNPDGDCFLRQSASEDGGRTWSVMHRTTIWGYPPHLLRLADGRLLVVYGRRAEPFGERAALSTDGGRSWDSAHELTIASAPNNDLGYPSTAQFTDGSLFTVYYQIDQAGEKTCLMGTHWGLPG